MVLAAKPLGGNDASILKPFQRLSDERGRNVSAGLCATLTHPHRSTKHRYRDHSRWSSSALTLRNGKV